MDGWMDGWMGGWVGGWVDRWMDWMDGWMERRKEVYVLENFQYYPNKSLTVLFP